MVSTSWRALVDPECPEVIVRHDNVAEDPLDLLSELTSPALDWEAQHREACDRCKIYGREDAPGNMTGE